MISFHTHSSGQFHLPYSPHRPIIFLTKPKRHYQTAILENSFGPNEKLKKTLSQRHSGPMTLHSRMKKPL